MFTVRNSLALPALGGQIKSKMIHQLDSSRPGSVAAAAAAASTARQLSISTGHTWLLCSVALTHHTVSDGLHEVQLHYQRRCYLSRTTKMTEQTRVTRPRHPRWNLSLMTFPFKSISGSDSVFFESEHFFPSMPFVDSETSHSSGPCETSAFRSSLQTFKHISASVIRSQCRSCGPVHTRTPPENRTPHPLLVWCNRCHL